MHFRELPRQKKHFLDPNTTFFPFWPPIQKNVIFETPLYKKCHFRDPPIQKMPFFRPPIQQNAIFETPLYKKCIFETPLYKKNTIVPPSPFLNGIAMKMKLTLLTKNNYTTCITGFFKIFIFYFGGGCLICIHSNKGVLRFLSLELGGAKKFVTAKSEFYTHYAWATPFKNGEGVGWN